MDAEVRQQIGARIRELRESMNLNQDEFGKLFGKTHQTVSKWELGKSMPALGDWYALGKMAGVSLDYLVYNVRTQPVSRHAIIGEIFRAPGAKAPEVPLPS